MASSSSSTSTINFSKVISILRTQTWEFCPGLQILGQANRNSMPSHTADAIFKKFIVEKIPQAEKLVSDLVIGKNISDIHAPFPLKTIFFIFIDDLVEHYQNQLEQRDEEVDRELIKIKHHLANNLSEVWPRERTETKDFLNFMKNKLSVVDAIPAKFDETIEKWAELLSIQYIGNVSLGSLFLNQHPDYKDKPHRLPRNSSKRSDDFVNITTFSRGMIESAFSLSLRQLSRDVSWITPEMIEKLQPLGDSALEKDFSKITSNNEKQDNTPVFSLVQEYEKQIKEFIVRLSLLNIQDNQQIEPLIQPCLDIQSLVCPQPIKEFSRELKMLENRDICCFKYKGIKITSQHPLFQPLINYSKCAQIKHNYLSQNSDSLFAILHSLMESNAYWQAHLTEGTPIEEAPQFFTIEDKDEKAKNAANRLLEEESKKSPPKNGNINRRAGNKKRRTPPQETKPQPPAGNESKPEAKKNIPPPAPPSTEKPIPTLTSTSSFPETLRGRLHKLHQVNSSAALRQAIWHLDHLIVIQNSLKDSAFSPPQFLTAVCATANSAQKTLEQMYRHALKEEGIPATHHLKTYHQKFSPKCTTYPPIVEELFLANNWMRSFYASHDKWSSLSTFVVKIPLILTRLVKLADGSTYFKKEVESIVNGTIEDTCKHVDNMLKDMGVSNESSAPMPYEQIHLVTPLQEKSFSEVEQKLKTLLSSTKSTPPVYLNVKQALAAVSMLECSVQQINKAKDRREFATWTAWSLHQLQESIESVLHSLEYYKNNRMSDEHELKTLAKKCNVEIGPLGENLHNLSYKARYPAVISNKTPPAQIIDDSEALKEHPELEKGSQLQSRPKMLWEFPNKEISLNKSAAQLQQLLLEGEIFLRTKAIPALQEAGKNKVTNGPASPGQ